MLIPKYRDFDTTSAIIDWCREYIFWLLYYYVDKLFLCNNSKFGFEGDFLNRFSYIDPLPGFKRRKSPFIKKRKPKVLGIFRSDRKIIPVYGPSLKLDDYSTRGWYVIRKFVRERTDGKFLRDIYTYYKTRPGYLRKPAFEWARKYNPFRSMYTHVWYVWVRAKQRRRHRIVRWFTEKDDEKFILKREYLIDYHRIRYLSEILGFNLLYRGIDKELDHVKWDTYVPIYEIDSVIYGNIDYFSYYYYEVFLFIYYGSNYLAPHKFLSLTSYEYLCDTYQLLLEVLGFYL